MLLEQLLTPHEYRTVEKVARGQGNTTQLPLVAWAMGFISLPQLDQILTGYEVHMAY
ncbi:DUF2949 domain-containing protein [Anthocerotibacter panamensis]|uniref:DUF2949 domain-containing protein n=1 Tax=Anthocerotibacter panamensis TaxID=2857077 RepID=UPI001C4056AC|nr:DUF2949 domain-containing protein [Anthocerotibacter panamensis]